MASTCVLSYWDLSIAASGGSRRINALLDTLGDSAFVIQPASNHPHLETVTFPLDLGRRKIGVNWGMFNFLWPPTRRIAERAIQARSPELLVMTSIWTLPVAARFPDIPKVLDAHDVNATAIAERFGANHLFTKLVRSYEAKAVCTVDHLFCCSASDRQRFIENYNISIDMTTVVPNGVDTGAFVNVRSEPDAFWNQHLTDFVVLFFMGKLDYQPNIAALNFLRESLMPELERLSPGRYKLLVTGGPVPHRQIHPSIVFAGRLPNDRLRQYMSRVQICLAPVFTGSGTRLKILEYMAAGKPVISTAKGAEGIGGFDGRDLYIVEPESFADCVEFLAAHPTQASVVGDSARKFVRERYDWVECIQPRWKNVFKHYLPATQS